MVRKYLGVTIDIHGGGQDLIFPHHENEIAQSEAANEKPFVNYWLHNGFINVDQEKMSKSTGNFFTVRDLVSKFDYQVLRFFMLSGHYRMPINFSSELLTAAQNGWERIRTCVSHLDFVSKSAPAQFSDSDAEQAETVLRASINQYQDDFVKAMDDDLNTADALAAVFEMVRAANSAAAVPGVGADTLRTAADKLREWLDVLGLNPDTVSAEIPQSVLDLVGARVQAKKDRDFARADQLRQEITDMGYQVMDTPQGPKVSAL
jgi:cysteinyl-tRNA synthetase